MRGSYLGMRHQSKLSSMVKEDCRVNRVCYSFYAVQSKQQRARHGCLHRMMEIWNTLIGHYICHMDWINYCKLKYVQIGFKGLNKNIRCGTVLETSVLPKETSWKYKSFGTTWYNDRSYARGPSMSYKHFWGLVMFSHHSQHSSGLMSGLQDLPTFPPK